MMLSVILLVLGIWLLLSVALVIHSYSSRFGLSPLIFYLAGTIAILNFAELMALFVVPVPGIVLRVGAHLFVPVILAVVLVLYIADGTQPAKIALFGLFGINLLTLFVVLAMALFVALREPGTLVSGLIVEQNLLTPAYIRGVFASTITFVANLLAMMIFYQGLRNVFPSIWKPLAIFGALLAGLWTDSLLFNLLTNIGTPTFQLWLPGDVVAKTLSAMVIAPLLAYYLLRIVPERTEFVARKERPTFDVLFRSTRALRETLDQLQGELRESKRTYQQLTDNIEEIFWMATVARGHFDYISPAFEKITGRPRDPYYGSYDGLLDIVHPDDRERFEVGMASYVRAYPDDEFRIICDDGRVRWLHNRTFPVNNDSGEVYRFVGITADVTDSKQVQAQEVALAIEQQSVETLRDFIRDAAHDLKNPLATIMLKVAMVRRSRTDEDRERHMTDLEERAEFLSTILDDLFTLSHLDDNANTNSELIDLRDIARKVTEHLRPQAQDKGIALLADFAETPVLLHANRETMRRLISNLTGNAIHYTMEGKVTVGLHRVDNNAVLTVADTGIGIAAEDVPRIFERFFRSDSVRERQINGTGLGLAIVQSIVTQYNGEISVDSTVGIGTTFTIKLPLADT